MYMFLCLLTINWESILFGSEGPAFLLEVMLRATAMFVIIVIGLRILGKRGVKQLSIFELVVILSLGSAAGDPMFYKDVGILSALMVFIIITALYTIITFFIGRSRWFEQLMEGKPVCLLKDGVFLIDNFRKEALGEDEFFSELRLQSVSHLGQVQEAIEERSGEISIFFYTDEEVRYGLPIMPDSLKTAVTQIDNAGYYACIFCGFSNYIEAIGSHTCPTCKKKELVKASNKKRIT